MIEDLKYQELIKEDVMEKLTVFHHEVQLLLEHPRPMMDGDTSLIYRGSPSLQSTAIGLNIETVIHRSDILDKLNTLRIHKQEVQEDGKLKSNQSCYDFEIDNPLYTALINVKARKKGGQDSGIAAYSSLLDCLEKKGVNKPVFYFVYVVDYEIDYDLEIRNHIGFDYYNLNNVIMETIDMDGRSWSKESKKITGRIMLHSGNSKLKNIVPTFGEFNSRIEDMRKLEIEGKILENYFYDGRPCDPNVKPNFPIQNKRDKKNKKKTKSVPVKKLLDYLGNQQEPVNKRSMERAVINGDKFIEKQWKNFIKKHLKKYGGTGAATTYLSC